jgi:hypothetical protein
VRRLALACRIVGVFSQLEETRLVKKLSAARERNRQTALDRQETARREAS